MGKFDVMVVSDIAVEEAETEAPLTLFGLIHPRTGKEVCSMCNCVVCEIIDY